MTPCCFPSRAPDSAVYPDMMIMVATDKGKYLATCNVWAEGVAGMSKSVKKIYDAESMLLRGECRA